MGTILVKRFKRILCVADLVDTSTPVLKRAVDLAQKNQAELKVIDFVELPVGEWSEHANQQQIDSIKRARRKKIEQTLAPYRERIAISICSVTETSTPFLDLVREVLRGEHDLVIRASSDPDWIDRVLGSDDMQLLRACPCPVWLIAPSAPSQYQRILVAVDVDRDYPAHELEARHGLNCQLLQLACSQAITESAELHVVHAWQSLSPTASYPGMPKGLVTDYIKRTRAEHNVELTQLLKETSDYIGSEAMQLIKRHEHMLDGTPRRSVPKLARMIDADLVVMGSVARTGIKGLLIGNTAESILNQLDCSVWVVKPPGFATPVSLDD